LSRVGDCIAYPLAFLYQLVGSIHPDYGIIDQDQFTSAIVQVLNVATSFGSSFSSGLFTFNGGDSIEENRKLLEALREKLNPAI
jgi:hypothetical protein